MRTGLRQALAIFTVVVAIMSGALSLVREYLLFQYPTKFQEAPLFWGCLRIAFGISLIALWYEERRKRVLLEADAETQPTISFKDEVLKLSTDIMDFIYDREKALPEARMPDNRFIGIGGDTTAWLNDMQRYNNQLAVVAKYEETTREMYLYKLHRRVREALARLKELGIQNNDLDDTVQAPESWVLPYSSSIKAMGKELGRMAEHIQEC